MESDEEKREDYLKEIEEISQENIVYLDESGIDVNACKDRGWGKVGKPLKAKKSGKYYQRINIIAGLNRNKSIAPFVFTGTCNTELFNLWVEKFLLPELKPGQIVVLDNPSNV